MADLDFNSLPLGANPDRDIPLPPDELGRPRFKTSGGKIYTITEVDPNPDYESEGGTWDRAKEIGGNLLKETLDAFKAGVTAPVRALRGEDVTYGDAVNTAGMVALGSGSAPVPEGSLRTFGGFRKSKALGISESGERLPTSTGKDSRLRFEIDDSGTSVDIYRIPQLASRNVINRDLQSFSPARLGEVFEHTELYRQYPELADVEVIFDNSLSNTSTYGYYLPGGEGLIALNPRIFATDPAAARFTLLHEIQHKIQDIEDFDEGTNPSSTYDYNVTKSISEKRYREGLKKEVEARQAYKEQMAYIEGYDPQDLMSTVEAFRDDLYGTLDAYGQQVFDVISEEFKDYFQTYSGLSLKKTLFRSASDLFVVTAGRIGDNPEASKLFKDWVGYSPEDFLNLTHGDRATLLDERGLVPKIPSEPLGILFPTQARVTNEDAYEAYRTRSGEVEARNVGTRADLSLDERRAKPPVTTEDTPRSGQWYIDDRGNEVSFAEGGLTMDEETKKAFPSKGVDPVSGNEVPPGSMPHEVRDDIDAKLSEGEYVVPADVLRYYGVAYFEKLRNKAKEALSEMDKEGRIGGDDEDDFPFDDDDLEVEDDAMGMAEGGIATTSEADLIKEQPTFNPAPWTYGGVPRGMGSSGTGVETRTYINKDGNRISVMFINGQPISQIPDGYVPDTEEGRKQFQQNAGETVADPSKSWDEDGRDNRESNGTTEPKEIAPEDNLFNMSEEELRDWTQKGVPDMFGKLGGLGGLGIAGSLVGGMASAYTELEPLQRARTAAMVAEERGLTELAAEMRAKEKELLDGLSRGSRMLEGSIATGVGEFNTHKKSYETYAVDGTNKPTGTRPTYGSTSSGIPESPITTTTLPGSTYRPNTGEARTLREGTVGVDGWNEWAMPPSESGDGNRDNASAGARGVGQETAAGGRQVTEGGVTTSGQQMSNPGGFDKEEQKWGSGPMAKGGLVKRRQPKTKKTPRKIKTVEK